MITSLTLLILSLAALYIGAGWLVQGRMEFGPRALGNRSILADPGEEEDVRSLWDSQIEVLRRVCGRGDLHR